MERKASVNSQGDSAEAQFWAQEQANSGWADQGSSFVPATVVPNSGGVPTLASGSDELFSLQSQSRHQLVAQRTGNIAWRATEDARRLMVLTKYGVKVTDMKCQEVFLRLPMHKICSAIRFIEDTGEHCVALEADDGNQGLFSYYVFQIPDDASDPRQGNAATVFCSTLDQAFEVMHSKTVLEAST
eukprot:gene23709-22028_t